MKKVELLAPVGKMENAIAAIENGADALFVGGKGFNARALADNFTEDELQQIVDYAALRGVKVYVTVNVLMKDAERSAVYDYLKYLEDIGVHAIIVQDLGIARMVRKYFPSLRLHASTQMSAHSLEDVMFLKTLGFKRVVLARELQLSEIREITSQCDIEIEAFVHGALCYSYSGQCLMSSLIGGRSGNRGRCAQPCRMRYTLKDTGNTIENKQYLLSLKDLCSLEFLPEVLEAGVHSLKIEGRMKSPEYVASVVGTYRKYLNLIEAKKPYKVAEVDLENMKYIFNRGGFSKGYYYERGNRKMLTDKSPRHMGVLAGEVVQYHAKTKLATILLKRAVNPGDGLEIMREGKESVGTGVNKAYEAGSKMQCLFESYVPVGSKVYLTKNHGLLKTLKASYQRPQRKKAVTMTIEGVVHEPIKIIMSDGFHEITYTGAVIEPAEQNPVSEEKAKRQLTKLGSTPFEASQVTIDWPSNAYIGISDLNEARRGAVLLLEQALLEKEKDEMPKDYPDIEVPEKALKQEKTYTAYVTSLPQLEAVLDFKEIKTIYWAWDYHTENALKACELCKAHDVSFYLALPWLMHEEQGEDYDKLLGMFKQTALTGFLVRTMGQFEKLKSWHKKLAINYNLNSMNHESVALWHELGATTVTLSPECIEMAPIGYQGQVERIIYGYIPVMTSSQCILRGTKSCQKGNKMKHQFEIEDRKDTAWQIQTDCKSCMMQIMSHQPIVLKGKTLSQSVMMERFEFTRETPEEVCAILRAYLKSEQKTITGVTFNEVL